MPKQLNLTVFKYGIGYQLVVDKSTGRLVLGIRCNTCEKVSFNINDVEKRYCGHCHVWHEEHLLAHEG